MDEPRQTYADHVHQPRAWSITWLVGLLVVLVLGFHLYREPSVVSVSLVILGGVVLSTLTLVRQFALRLQNRIIRMEMQVRLARLGREADIQRVTLPQLIALRFAPDAELPLLIDRAVAEGLKPDDIKRAVRDWQGDYLRT